jgi:hypothetical protein
MITYKTPSGQVETVECDEADMKKVLIELIGECNEIVEVKDA